MKDIDQLKEYHDSIYKGSVDFNTFDEEYRKALKNTYGFAFFRLGKAVTKFIEAVKGSFKPAQK